MLSRSLAVAAGGAVALCLASVLSAGGCGVCGRCEPTDDTCDPAPPAIAPTSMWRLRVVSGCVDESIGDEADVAVTTVSNGPDPYVTVDIGDTQYTTRTLENIHEPLWDEEVGLFPAELLKGGFDVQLSDDDSLISSADQKICSLQRVEISDCELHSGVKVVCCEHGELTLRLEEVSCTEEDCKPQ